MNCFNADKSDLNKKVCDKKAFNFEVNIFYCFAGFNYG